MKLVLILLVLFVAYNSKEQQQNNSETIINNVDSLAKYSYLIFGYNVLKHTSEGDSINFIIGTCFFVQDNDITFLVSAKHVLTGWNTDSSKKTIPYPDTLCIRLYDSQGNIIFVPIRIKRIKDTIKGGYGYSDPDVFVYKCEEVKNYKINSIKAFYNQNKDKYLRSISVYGYPFHESINHQNIEKFSNQKPILTEGIMISALSDKVLINRLNKTFLDTLNYHIKTNVSVSRQGYSGSPVFTKNKQNNQWLFYGIFSMEDKDYLGASIVKPNIVIQKIKERIHTTY